MEETISIAQFIHAIRRLPSDEPHSEPGLWYKTQKEHWLGWLREYDGPGAYGRALGKNRDAKFAYNHVVCPEMLLWLIQAAGLRKDLVEAAGDAATTGATPMQRSRDIRKHVPWTELQGVLWGSDANG